MAEINFGLIDTQAPARIANALMPSPEQQGAQALQVMQMQQAARQGQVSQMQFQKMKRENDMLETIRAKIIANGGPPDLRVAARAMIETGDPEHILMGQKIETSVRQQEEAAQYRRDNNVNVPVANNLGAPTATMPPMTDAPAATMPPMTGVPTATMPPMTGVPASTGGNALTGMVTPPAVPPVVANNLVPGSDPSAPLKTKLDGLIRNYHRIGNNPELQSEKALLLKQIEDVQHSLRDLSVLPPDVKLMQALGIPATQAGFAQLTALKQDPGEFERMLRAVKLPPDEERAIRMQFLKTKSTHALPTQLKVNTFVPASETAQAEFMKETRAAYSALKNSPAMFANIEAAKKLIPSASAFMGAGGEGLKQAASFLNNRFNMAINTEGVKDATELQSRLFQGILDNLKKLDSQPSERQQAALQEALGSLSTDPNALSNVLDAYADSARNKIDIHNAEVQSAIARGVKFPYDPIIKIPPKTAAGVVTTNPQYPGFSIGKN